MEIKQVLVRNTWLSDTGCPHGWGNGYIGVPKGHPWHGKHYNDIPCVVHGGLTFSEPDVFAEGLWWLGFDTAHWGDDAINCDLCFVAAETERLVEQANREGKKLKYFGKHLLNLNG